MKRVQCLDARHLNKFRDRQVRSEGDISLQAGRMPNSISRLLVVAAMQQISKVYKQPSFTVELTGTATNQCAGATLFLFSYFFNVIMAMM